MIMEILTFKEIIYQHRILQIQTPTYKDMHISDTHPGSPLPKKKCEQKTDSIRM